jgi:hypothetical protein
MTWLWFAVIVTAPTVVFAAVFSGPIGQLGGGPDAGDVALWLSVEAAAVIFGFVSVAWTTIVLIWAEDTAAIKAKLYEQP